MKKLITLAKKLLIITVGASLLFGCANYQETKSEIRKTQQQISGAQDMDSTSAPAAINLSGYYTDKTPVEISNDPAWLSHSISLQAKKMPLNVLMQRLLRTTKIVASYDGSTQPDMPVNINYTGSIKGALKYISAKTGLHYNIHNQSLRWSAFMTKTFNVSFMPGSSSYAVGQLSGAGAGAAAGGGGGGQEEGMSQNMVINDQQHSDLSAAELSVWKDLEKTLEQLKSEKGKIVISESTTTVTVHDYPANVAAISKYIQHINDILSKEVAIKVEILDIQLNKQFQFGIDWGLASKMTLGNRHIPIKIEAPSFAGVTAGTSNSPGEITKLTFGGNNQSIISALNEQGSVSVVTQPKVVTMNNQMASIRITQDQGYLKSVATILNGVGGQSQTTLTPGNITDGLTLFILPKIQKDKVIMQISSTLASLVKIEKVSSAPEGESKGDYSAIQTPTINQKQFNQRSAVMSGETLIIAGYKSLHNETSQAGIIEPLGGRSSLTKNRETIVLITPTILNRAATQ